MPLNEWVTSGTQAPAEGARSGTRYAGAPSYVDLWQGRSDYLVKTEAELRNALSRIRTIGRPAKVTLGGDITLTEPVEIDDGFPTLHIAGDGPTQLFLASGAYHFGIENSFTVLDGLTLTGATSSDYAAKAISLRGDAALAQRVKVADCYIYADECVVCESDGPSQFYVELRGNYFRGSDSAKYLATMRGTGHMVSGNQFRPTGTGNGALLLFDMIGCSVSANYFGNGDIHIDSTSGNTYSNTIIGNNGLVAVTETNNGGTLNAIMGNAFSGASVILTNLGSGSNTIIGNVNVATITAHASDVYDAATDSDPLNT